ncbi:MAG: hypothetical protein JKY19_11555 [Alcanivoracaceae bacterium]|nr:hypothetical protein [Alcanivoracaceae bacterium]
MKLETQRFFNLEKFKWKYAQDMDIDASRVTDKSFASWLGIAPKYYSNWKNQKKFMNSVSARKFEKKLDIPQFTLDVIHVQEDIFSEFQKDCFLEVRKHMIDHSINIDSTTEISIASQLFHQGKANGLRIDQALLRQLTLTL